MSLSSIAHNRWFTHTMIMRRRRSRGMTNGPGIRRRWAYAVIQYGLASLCLFHTMRRVSFSCTPSSDQIGGGDFVTRMNHRQILHISAVSITSNVVSTIRLQVARICLAARGFQITGMVLHSSVLPKTFLFVG